VTVLAALALLALGAGGAAAQLPGLKPPPPPTDTTRAYTLAPKFDSTLRGSITQISLDNKFNATMKMSNGYNAIFNLGVGETHFRLQDRLSSNKNMQLTFAAPIRPGLIFDAAATENKTFDRVITVGNRVQELTNNPRTVRSGLSLIKFHPSGLILDMKAEGDVSRVGQTFQVDHNVSGDGRAALKIKRKALPQEWFTPWIGAWKVSAEARGWYGTRYTETDDDTRQVRERGLGAEQDSLKSWLRLDMTADSFVEGRYERYYGIEDRMTFPRGVIGDQQFGAELIRETQLHEVTVTQLRGQSQPTPHMTFGLSYEHRNDLNDFQVQKEQFRHTISERVAGNVTFDFWRLRFGVTMQVDSTRNDLGPLSVSSYTDRKRSLRFTTDFLGSGGNAKLQTQYGISLLQQFYFDYANNPRDRDQQDAYFNVRLKSDPFRKVSTNIYMSLTRAEYVSISGQYSQNNRSELTYDFRPEITYTLNDRIEIKQTYGLNISFTDQFNESPGIEDLLDRNVTFTNIFKVQLTPRLRGDLLYSMLLHDRGTYLPLDQENPDYSQRYFSSQNEDRRDQMDISFNYKLTNGLFLLGKNRYSRRVDRFLASGQKNVFTDGGIELGARGNYQWGPDRTLSFRMVRVKQFGNFTRPEQEDFWLMNTEFSFAF